MKISEITQMNTYQKVDENVKKDAQKSKEAEFRKYIQQHAEEIREKLKNGDTEVYIQTGAEAMTEDEWGKMLEKFDSIQEMIRALMEERIEKVQTEKQMETDQTPSGCTR